MEASSQRCKHWILSMATKHKWPVHRCARSKTLPSTFLTLITILLQCRSSASLTTATNSYCSGSRLRLVTAVRTSSSCMLSLEYVSPFWWFGLVEEQSCCSSSPASPGWVTIFSPRVGSISSRYITRARLSQTDTPNNSEAQKEGCAGDMSSMHAIRGVSW